MMKSRRSVPSGIRTGFAVVLLLAVTSMSTIVAVEASLTIDFNGFADGVVVRDEFISQGLRLPPGPDGGPFIEDAGGLSFLLDTPPNLLSLNPLAAISIPGQAFASVGTYVFDFVDPTNPNVPSFTDAVELVVVFVDKGDSVLTAFDASGQIVDEAILNKFSFTFGLHVLRVEGPGIQKVTFTTPLEPPTIGALVDTLSFNEPAILPSRAIDIDVKIGSRRNIISLSNPEVRVAILSGPDLDPSLLDASKVLFQGAAPVMFSLRDNNHDRVPDLILSFRTSDLQGLVPGINEVELLAVDVDGTSLKGSDAVMVKGRQRQLPTPPRRFGGQVQLGPVLP